MDLHETVKLLWHLIKYKLTQTKHDIDYRPQWIESEKFISARQAAMQIKDDAVVISTGMASHGRCSIFFWAIRDLYKKKKHPKNLTWITVSAQGGRGKIPGTIEDMALSGLISEYISGHVETAKAFLEMGDRKQIEIHILPQGEMTALLLAQAHGQLHVRSKTGLGTFIDPDLGGTTAVTPESRKSYAMRTGEDMIFTMPKIQVALMVAPYADREGNIYFKHASTITENYEAAMTANANDGKVFVTVSSIIDKDEAEIRIPKEKVHGIIVNPWNEQAGSIRQKRYWPLFTEGAQVDPDVAVSKLKIINTLARVTPRRGPMENLLARMAASLFTHEAQKGDLINLGIGIPEEVGRLIYESGLHQDLTFSSESGAIGGIPTSGLFFGGAVNPVKLNSSAWIFNHYKSHLAIAVLGFLQVDSQGNVNASKRGNRVYDYVGPGGSMNIADGAKTIIFVGSFMAKARFKLKNGNLRIRKKGIFKFVDRLREVTFNAGEALKKGKKVFYVTSVGIFRLTEQGVEVYRVMPGLDIQKEIIENSTARIIVPTHLKTIPPEIVTGKNFKLCWPSTTQDGIKGDF